MNEELLGTKFQVYTPDIRKGEWVRSRRTYMSLFLAAADLFGFSIAWVLALLLRFTVTGLPIPNEYRADMILLPFILLVNHFTGLYNHNISEVEELRRLLKSISTYFLVGFAVMFLVKEGEVISRLVIAYAWTLSLILLPLLREAVRTMLVRFGQWGEPVVIFGNGRLGNEVAAYLRAHPRMGYNPVGVVDRRKVERNPCADGKVIHDAEIFTNGNKIPSWMQGVRTAFVVTPETSQSVHDMLIGKQTIRFEQLILVRSAERVGSLWVQPLDIGGILGLEVGQNLLNRNQLNVKRFMDLMLIFLSLPVLVPLLAIVALIIKLDSPGGVLYYQDRVGYGGKMFKFWKFRSMYLGAEEKLQEYLDANPDKKAEYEVNHKLKNDPRVTRFGKIIRKLSIDELPQLMNVIRGEMSSGRSAPVHGRGDRILR